MSGMIKQLHTDHMNMARLLDLIDEQMELFHTGNAPDYVLMMDIMQYMANYPDLFHHPLEDLIFQRLVELDEGMRSMVTDIIQEHEVLARQSETLFNVIKTVMNEYPVARGELELGAREYVSTLRAHMNTEEARIFPAIQETLTDEDWEAIQLAMGHTEDPLFGKKAMETEYAALYDYIQDPE
uniref:Hemerythrin-like domain-containing protein n=1 Tax=Candidatus Kentrum sp. SD TaxID=2126332 RepID=A0A450YRK1_9GAMM|nr:MAG: Hemerythrin-like domain-containing protein [Candidatus Kentron sp. SD]VFK44119.1 MAG: Hemerythrin-like domain-containing protein [Candidatus Kentron sp. SD]VFK79122.1 MAG: Hemerythrin-like domain-containing protein [Candidatus Kentron sp. SD]